MYSYIPISPPSAHPSATPSHPSYPTPLGVTKHRADLPVLCSFFLLPVYLTFGSVYMSVLLSQFVLTYPSLSRCPQVHSLRLCLYSCLALRCIRTIFFLFLFFFRFHICVLAYSICFSLSDLLHSVLQTLGPSTSLK